MFIPVLPDAAPRPPVYLFPHAGAAPAVFAPFARAWSDRFRLFCLDLPGRLDRFDEPVRTKFEPLVRDLAATLADEVRGLGDQPFVLLGSCGGAFLALETARALRAKRVRGPDGLVVLSTPAPDVAVPPLGVPGLPSAALWEEVIAHGGIPERLRADASFRRLAERALRADYALYADYRHLPAPPLDTRLVALHGRADGELRRGEVLGWRRQAGGQTLVRAVDDAGRWLIDEAPDEVGRAVAECL
ncbi:thioesterase [Nonomuraea sp. KC401]|uniref:thioesterase II family protein n=1 Tax=unclassified Nonomuraea TaxID=2593643 RepID=UPI0010FDAC67|nr:MULTISPECIES: thioesterase domain-containing protein [unclassified Nonomuraea]NBE97993.1 alpha/beta fold hydrolase [Nonomuraea sp. K271]TLF61831.1 thioesterase [Nonomuraea sp. KC401]